MRDDTIPFSARQLAGLSLLALGWLWALAAAPPPARPLAGTWELAWGRSDRGYLLLRPDGSCESVTYGVRYEGSWSVRQGCLFCDETPEGSDVRYLTQYPLWGDSATGRYRARALLSVDGAGLFESEWFELRRAGQ